MPTPSEAHVDEILTNVSLAYLQNPAQFVAGKIFPSVDVNKQSNKYFVYDKEAWMRDEMEKRGPGADVPEVDFPLSTDNYFCDVWSLGATIDEQEEDNADEPIDVRQDKTRLLTEKYLLKKENQFVNNFMNSSSWDNSTDLSASGETQWDSGSSTIISDISEDILTIWQNTGRKPNVFAMDPQTFNQIRQSSEFTDRVKYTSDDSVTAQQMANLIDINLNEVTNDEIGGPSMEVYVIGGVENTAAEGASFSGSFINSKQALLAYRAPSPSLRQPSAGYTFTWNGRFGMETEGVRMLEWEKNPHVDKIEIETAFDMKVTGSDLGHFYDNTISDS